VILAGAFLLSAGCAQDDSSTNAITGTTADEVAYQALVDRETTHYAAAAQSTTPTALLAETVDYASDMDVLVDEFRTACERVGGAGMMGRMEGDLEALHRTMDDMRGAVHEHHEQMGTLATLEEMHSECEQHHLAMQGMLGSMGDLGHPMPGGCDGEPPPDGPHSGHHR
jgi:hypothetical protein